MLINNCLEEILQYKYTILISVCIHVQHYFFQYFMYHILINKDRNLHMVSFLSETNLFIFFQ